MRRAGFAAVLLAVVTCGGAGVAAAHTGVGAAFRGEAGPFTLNAFDGRAAEGGALEFRLVIQRDGDPVDGADVTIEADLLDVPREHVDAFAASSVANVYTYRLPDRGVVPWRVHVTVRAGATTGQTRFEVHGPPRPVAADLEVVEDSSRVRIALIAATVGLVVVAGTLVGLRRLRDNRTG